MTETISLVHAVRTTVTVNDKLFELGQDGRLGILQAGDKVRLDVTIHGDNPRLAFTVNEDSNASLLRNPKGSFSRSVGVRSGRTPDFGIVGYPHNHICLALLGEEGAFSIVKTGLVTQGKVTYLVTYNSAWRPQLFRESDNNVRCPLFEKGWETLTALLCQVFATHSHNFAFLPAGYTLPQETEAPLPEGENVGVVTYFELLKGVGGVGAIKTAKGLVRVQWQQAPPAGDTDLRYLEKGELVSFERLDPTQGKTQFKFDAIGVDLL